LITADCVDTAADSKFYGERHKALQLCMFIAVTEAWRYKIKIKVYESQKRNYVPQQTTIRSDLVKTNGVKKLEYM
jgi:cell division protein FtsX